MDRSTFATNIWFTNKRHGHIISLFICELFGDKNGCLYNNSKFDLEVSHISHNCWMKFSKILAHKNENRVFVCYCVSCWNCTRESNIKPTRACRLDQNKDSSSLWACTTKLIYKHDWTLWAFRTNTFSGIDTVNAITKAHSLRSRRRKKFNIIFRNSLRIRVCIEMLCRINRSLIWMVKTFKINLIKLHSFSYISKENLFIYIYIP